MLRCKKVAITGGVSSGKSSVCRILSDLGAYVADADTVVHSLLFPESNVGGKVLELLGSEVIVGDCFNRDKIAEKVFSQPVLLHALERILHPAVREEITKIYQQVNEKYPLFVVEVPLLYEAGWENDFDVVVAVIADEKAAQERYEVKSHKDDFQKRMVQQMNSREKAEKADFVIVNNGTLLDLTHATKQLYPILLAI